MADKTASDAPVKDAIDTSTNEDDSDTTDVEDFGDVSWDEGEVVPDKEFDSNGKEKSADDSDTEEEDSGSDSKDDVESEDTEDADDSEAESENDQEESADSEDDAKKESTDLEAERKAHNDEMAKARIAERKAKDEAEAVRKKSEEATIERYLEDAGDDEIERERRELNVEQYRIREEKIVLNNDRIQSGIEKAVASIDLFRTGNPVVQEELASSLDSFEAQFIEKDKNGRPVSIKIDPATGKPADVFQYLQRKADSIKKLTGIGARQQDKSKSNEKTRTLTPPVKAPKKAKTDPDLEGFDEEASRW
jgi:hypothetical protein